MSEFMGIWKKLWMKKWLQKSSVFWVAERVKKDGEKRGVFWVTEMAVEDRRGGSSRDKGMQKGAELGATQNGQNAESEAG